MRIGRASRALAAAAAVIVAAVVAPGCDAVPDEQLLRFLGFRAGGTTTGKSIVYGKLDGKFDKSTDDVVDAAFENATFTAGNIAAGGTGILVQQARVTYSLAGAPSYEYPLTLYLPAPEKAGDPTSGTLAGFPLLPATLEQWILANVSGNEASFSASVTFTAETDDGYRLETIGGISVMLTR